MTGPELAAILREEADRASWGHDYDTPEEAAGYQVSASLNRIADRLERAS